MAGIELKRPLEVEIYYGWEPKAEMIRKATFFQVDWISWRVEGGVEYGLLSSRGLQHTTVLMYPALLEEVKKCLKLDCEKKSNAYALNLISSGFAGIGLEGDVVDVREFPDAIKLRRDSMWVEPLVGGIDMVKPVIVIEHFDSNDGSGIEGE